MLNPSAKRHREDEHAETDEPHARAMQQKKVGWASGTFQLASFTVYSIPPPSSDRVRPGPPFPPSSTLTPAESSDDDLMQDGDRDLSQNRHPDLHAQVFSSMRTPYAESDSDFEMADSQPRSAATQPLWSAGSGPSRPECNLESPIPSFLLNRSLSVSGGRTATPIFSHFTSNMNTDSMMRDATLFPAEPQVPHTSQPVPTDEAGWWRPRRLPSPISEDETLVNPADPDDNLVSRPDQAGTFSGPYNPSTPLISVTPVQNDVPPSGSLHDQPQNPMQASQDTNLEHLPLPLENNSADNNDHLTAPPARPAFNSSNRSQVQPLPKRTIAMGFRADCEKCRQRVPGHYSHIIITK
ncbi:hypothetical protein CIHG_07736 [Coccidioides immitis H538.4]|uniref:Uncharacterized protein n=2 Tax=Coccidioides immitis TaxID=5501 RepID=A0A0J8RZ46_COCIT|nr:hypothetical protein CIRG_04209 [Coccidioides immitis RMSCC 2394]KMU90052.1 hypothetical protein CIHG_07736 [Coccidioides immitis H538.4]